MRPVFGRAGIGQHSAPSRSRADLSASAPHCHESSPSLGTGYRGWASDVRICAGRDSASIVAIARNSSRGFFTR
ncbi:MAG: hypothetical protein IGR92_12675 [Leptolyngbyaceae cyanobacterium T60_A2020_046]|nr:hypothetical protein [Leptolyngbyaceae cyanobacterium T60_A2020_046]